MLVYNVNPNNHNRTKAWNELLKRFHLRYLDIGHPTYHHFVGQCDMDSQLDVLVSSPSSPDQLIKLICSKECEIVKCSHNVVLSSFSLSSIPAPLAQVPKAPRVSKKRYRVAWDNQGINQYIAILATSLPTLIEQYSDHDDPSNFQTLLTRTAHNEECCLHVVQNNPTVKSPQTYRAPN